MSFQKGLFRGYESFLLDSYPTDITYNWGQQVLSMYPHLFKSVGISADAAVDLKTAKTETTTIKGSF